MKKPKVEKINLPYASSVASFFGDQGGMQGNSFLGRLFKGGGRPQQSNTMTAPPAATTRIAPTVRPGRYN